MGRVEEKVAFITGAARGQGRSHAVRLAEEGADIIGVDLCRSIDTLPYELATDADLEETVRLVEKAGRRMLALHADVRDYGQLKEAVDAGVAEFGRIDIAVLNAGIFSLASALELTDAQWEDMLAVNISGVWRSAKAVVPAMIAGGRGGSIILIGSTASIKGAFHTAHYSAAKHGVVGLTRTLALELGEHWIRVNAVAPTGVNTAMIMGEHTYALFAPEKEQPTKDDFEAVMTPLHILPVPYVEPIDVSNAVLWLASDESRYVTAITLPVDAGWTQR